MRDYDSSTMGSYTVQGQGVVLYEGTEDQKSVIMPVTESKKMQDVLSIFQGKATMAAAPSSDESTPEQQQDVIATATTLAAVATTIAPKSTTTVPSNTPRTTTPPTTTTSTTIVVNVENYSRGITPPSDPSCY
jgi:hypothetical protein